MFQLQKRGVSQQMAEAALSLGEMSGVCKCVPGPAKYIQIR